MQRAEWSHLVRPGALEPLADQYLDCQIHAPQSDRDIRRPARLGTARRRDRPQAPALGLAEPTNTPRAARRVVSRGDAVRHAGSEAR